MSGKTSIIVASLSNKSCLQYSSEIVEALKKEACISLTSQKSSRVIPSDYSFTVYQNKCLLLIAAPIFLFRAFKLLSTLQNGDKNILLINSFHPWNYLLLLIAQRLNFKTVYTVHDYELHLGEESPLTEYIQKKCISLSTHCLFLSEHEKQKAPNRIQEKSFILQHPILSVKKFNTLNHSLPIKILFIGRIKAYKGINNLLEIIKQNQDIKFTIAGKGQLPTHLKFKNLKLIPRHLSYIEMEDLMSENHYLILPYLEGSQSGVLAYGIANGIVPILSNLKSFKEQLDENCGIWIKNQNMQEVMDNLRYDSYRYTTLKNNISQFKIKFIEEWNLQLRTLIEKMIKH